MRAWLKVLKWRLLEIAGCFGIFLALLACGPKPKPVALIDPFDGGDQKTITYTLDAMANHADCANQLATP